MKEISCKFDDILIEASELLCHTSRLANNYEPDIEYVKQHKSSIPGCNSFIRIEHKETLPFINMANASIKRKLKYFMSSAKRKSENDLGEQLIYDARHIFNGNMAHLVQHHLTALGLFNDKLGYGKDDISIVLDGCPSKMAIQAFNIIGYNVILSDGPVKGNIISITDCEFFHLLPYVNSLDIDFLKGNQVEKIFVSRKNTRKIINECEINGVLKNEGFQKFYFEDMSIIEQWSLMRHASEVVGIHGAALGCMAFNKQNISGGRVKLIELFGSGFVVNPFRKFIAVLQGHWVGCRGKITQEVIRDIDIPGMSKKHAFDDFELDPKVLEIALSLEKS